MPGLHQFNLKYLLFAVTILINFNLRSQTDVEIIGGNKLSVDQVKGLQYIVGNVAIRHNGVIIQCDSAIRKMNEGKIEGFGHIYIYQPDTFTLSGGEYLLYEEASKTAVVTGKEVILKDQSMTLVTTSLQYNIQSQVGSYLNGANILNEGNTLKSRKGFYDRRANVFHFKDQVKLTSPEYTMEGDTLDYYSTTKTAYFTGPTTIKSKENTINCKNGWYNTAKEIASFSQGAEISSKNNLLKSDSLYYDRKQGYGKATGNIELIDSVESFTIFGQSGFYNQKTKESYVSKQPVAMQAKDDDTLFILADTFYFNNDSLNKIMRAYHQVQIFQKDMKGRCDSLDYRFNDSTISLFYAPILWNEKNQISGDTMFIQLKNKRIHTLKVNENAFLASEVKPGYYNQISGKQMVNYFDSNKLKSVLVQGNAQSIYYLRDNETDSAEYTGVNKVACGKMLILLDSSKVKAIKFYTQPEGKMYPLNQFPDSERYLKGLIWRDQEMPKVEEFKDRMKKQVNIPVKVIEKKEAKPLKTKGKNKASKSKKVSKKDNL
jgi:lipopolysaccharide export system protein LptA